MILTLLLVSGFANQEQIGHPHPKTQNPPLTNIMLTQPESSKVCVLTVAKPLHT
jgi:hypothetical protein